MPWRRKWQTTPVFLPVECHGQRSLEDYSPWVTKSWTGLSDKCCCSLFSCQVKSDSLWSHGLQHAKASLSLTFPEVCPSSFPLRRGCHPIISSSVTFFSFCFQSFPASGSFPMSWVFTSAGKSIGASPSASVLPMSIQSWFPLRLTGFISFL